MPVQQSNSAAPAEEPAARPRRRRPTSRPNWHPRSRRCPRPRKYSSCWSIDGWPKASRRGVGSCQRSTLRRSKTDPATPPPCPTVRWPPAPASSHSPPALRTRPPSPRCRVPASAGTPTRSCPCVERAPAHRAARREETRSPCRHPDRVAPHSPRPGSGRSLPGAHRLKTRPALHRFC